ncbi:peptidoglycan DD-metalloendopeptidase family protein [Virgibacillus flavescens]|uniref:peptidoglycan DD-metalloendopeptidase family protein n=1 Tax=Virgibacillus flavescens TaxID=1611422 RepID=UPI003D34E0B8
MNQLNPRVNKVRKSINSRKKTRGVVNTDSNKNQFSQFQVQEEEKHGYFPLINEPISPGKLQSKMVSGFILKGILSGILFLGTAILLQTENKLLEEPQLVASSLLTNEFPFAKVNQWYQETLGTPLALTPEQNSDTNQDATLALPVSGNISESFQANGEGVLISPGEESSVSVLNSGVIIFAGNDQETDKTIMVQHANGSTSTYGFLSSINVHLYEFVDSNQVIGEFVPTEVSESVYFAIEKNDEYVDPVQVIEVDDLP